MLLVLGLDLSLPAAERLKAAVAASDEVVDMSELGGSARSLEIRPVAWVPPVYPAEPEAAWSEEHVVVGFQIAESGTVSGARALSGPERFREPAVAAVKQWKFRSQLLFGKPLTYEVRVPFYPAATPPRTMNEVDEMTRAYLPESPSPGDPVNSEPLYPSTMEPRRLSGDVELLLGINEEGKVDGVKIFRAFHPDFLTAALDTVAAWECRPAHRGHVPKRGEKGVVLSFYTTDEDGRDNRADWMERNGIFLREPAGTKVVDYFDVPVEAVRMVDPVYPYELLLAGTRGGARVDFRIDARGRVGEVTVAEATQPEFGQSLAAAITAWQFRPLRRGGEAVTALFSITWRFEAPRPDSTEHRLLTAAGEQGPVNARALDRPLFPLFQRTAIFPPDRFDAGEGGRAEVEFIIDRTGRVRLPRVRGTNEPSFGWAAATALSQWLFETPLKDGQPVDVRVAVPMEFAPPERPAPDAVRPPDVDPIPPP